MRNLNDELMDQLKQSDLEFEIVLYDSNNSDLMEFGRQRSLERGNTDDWWSSTKTHVENLYNTYKNRSDLNVVIFTDCLSLTDYLKQSNVELIPDNESNRIHQFADGLSDLSTHVESQL